MGGGCLCVGENGARNIRAYLHLLRHGQLLRLPLWLVVMLQVMVLDVHHHVRREAAAENVVAGHAEAAEAVDAARAVASASGGASSRD